MGENEQDKQFFRDELHRLDSEYQETTQAHSLAQEDHAAEAAKHAIEEKAKEDKERHHKQVKDMVKEELEALDRDIEAAKTEIKALEAKLQTKEGEEVDAAVDELKALMKEYVDKKTRYDAIVESTNIGDKAGCATLKTKTLKNLAFEIDDLSNAIDSVVRAPNFAPEKPRSALIETVKQAKAILKTHESL